MSDIFIAHVEKDAEVALEIALGLEEAGYTTWCYEVDSIPGPSYLLQTGQAVEQCKAFVLVISPHSVGSRQVTRELVHAHESNKEFIPVRRGITHIEFQAQQPEWREAVGAASSIEIPPEGVASILPRIIDGLKKLGIHAGRGADVARIAQVRKVLGQVQRGTEEARKEAERQAKEKAGIEAEEARKAREAEEEARKEAAERQAKEKARLEAEEEAKKEAERQAKEKARIEAEEARKAREAEEEAKKEAERQAKEKAEIEAVEKVAQPPVPTREPELESVGAEVPREREKPAVSLERPTEAVEVSKSRWLWAGIALLVIGFGLALLVALGILQLERLVNLDLFIGVLLFLAPLTAGGIYCLRRGTYQARLTRPAEGTVRNWWWLPPVVLAFVGGIISWAKQKDVNWRKAMNMLTLGIVATFIWTIGFFAFFTPTPGLPVIPEVEPTGPPPVTPEVEPAAPPPETPEAEPLVPPPLAPETTLPAPPMQLLYQQDDFSDSSTGWDRVYVEDCEADYKDGEYCILLKKCDWAQVFWEERRLGPFTDFVLEIDAKLAKGPKSSCYGVVFRLQDGENFYRFLVSGDGYYVLGTQTEGLWTELQPWIKSAFIEGDNGTNRLKIVCDGSRIELYVNDHHLTTVTDDSFPDGYVGMIVEADEPNTQVAFDNIEIYSLALTKTRERFHPDVWSSSYPGW